MKIPFLKRRPFVLGSFSPAEAEKLRFLRTNFLSAVKKAGEETKLVLCAADCKAEELARAALDLGCALTAVGKKVLVLDIDRKNAMVGRLTGGTGRTFNDYLAGNADVDALGEMTEIEGLSIIASEPAATVSMRDDANTFALFRALRERFDYVLVVTAPVKDGADAFSCDEAADAVMLFIKKDATHIGFLKKMMTYYDGRGRKVLGTVII